MRIICSMIFFITLEQYEIDLDIEEHGAEHRSRETFGSYGIPMSNIHLLQHI